MVENGSNGLCFDQPNTTCLLNGMGYAGLVVSRQPNMICLLNELCGSCCITRLFKLVSWSRVLTNLTK
jgi:hypothetical protein